MIFWSHGSHLWHHDLASLNSDKIRIIMEFKGGREKLVRIAGVDGTPHGAKKSSWNPKCALQTPKTSQNTISIIL